MTPLLIALAVFVGLPLVALLYCMAWLFFGMARDEWRRGKL